jgi:hypothetical protein
MHDWLYKYHCASLLYSIEYIVYHYHNYQGVISVLVISNVENICIGNVSKFASDIGNLRIADRDMKISNREVFWFGMAHLNCGPIRQLPCRPLFLSWGIPTCIPTDLSDFPLANSCGNDTYVFEISWMCVSRLENCNKWRRMWKNSFWRSRVVFL